jgi:hypothetical protein
LLANISYSRNSETAAAIAKTPSQVASKPASRHDAQPEGKPGSKQRLLDQVTRAPTRVAERTESSWRPDHDRLGNVEYIFVSSLAGDVRRSHHDLGGLHDDPAPTFNMYGHIVYFKSPNISSSAVTDNCDRIEQKAVLPRIE